jgi:protein-L-isoaspartate(D-aspartate) O-methyltransferase
MPLTRRVGAPDASIPDMGPAEQRRNMVARDIRARGIADPRVLDALATVPRHAFVPAGLGAYAYDDRPLPIEAGQTISQPYIVALMTEALQLDRHDVVLEIGTGSGYAAAVLARIARRVDTIERIPELADRARHRLAVLGHANVTVRCGDGTLGWAEHAPYDAIVVTAGGPDVPQALRDQLAIGGRLVMPIGPPHAQTLIRATRTGVDEFRTDDLGPVAFVPLIGAQGWAAAQLQ